MLNGCERPQFVAICVAFGDVAGSWGLRVDFAPFVVVPFGPRLGRGKAIFIATWSLHVLFNWVRDSNVPPIPSDPFLRWSACHEIKFLTLALPAARLCVRVRTHCVARGVMSSKQGAAPDCRGIHTRHLCLCGFLLLFRGNSYSAAAQTTTNKYRRSAPPRVEGDVLFLLHNGEAG